MTKASGSFCISVDFGTTNTLVYAKDMGVVVNQASLLAIKLSAEKANRPNVFGSGSSVFPLIGRTAAQSSVEAPLASGVIRNPDLANLFLRELLASHLPRSRRLSLPYHCRGVLISAPRDITQYERSAFHDAARSLGFGRVSVVDEPLAAALGSGLPIFAPKGQMLVDVGSGITEAVIVSSGTVVESGSFRQGGNDLDQQIVDHIAQQHRFKISLGHARNIKEHFCALGVALDEVEIPLQGKCLVTKLPSKRSIYARELSTCIEAYVLRIENLILKVLEGADPELVSDVLENGVWLSGGGALLSGLSNVLERRLGIVVQPVRDPLGAVIAGNGMIVRNSQYASLCRTDVN